MPSTSLSPIKEFQIDLVNTLHRATILEVKLKQAEEWATRLDRLDLLTNMNGDLGSELDEDLELTVSDASAITKEREDKFRDIQQFRAELEEIINCLQGHYEGPLDGFLSADDDESVHHYGRQLISWFKSIRGHLIEISGRTRVILEEKGERKKKQKEELKFLQEVLDQMATLETYVMKADSKLNEVVQRQNLTTSGENKTIPKLPDVKDVDDPPANWQNDFTVLLEDTKTDLRDFRASQPTYAAKASTLYSQTTNAYNNAPPGHPIIPVRNVEIDTIKLDLAIRQIVIEEFNLLYSHFFSSLRDETGKREEESISNLTTTMAEGNKLACKLMVTYPEIGDNPLNGRPDFPRDSMRLLLTDAAFTESAHNSRSC